MRKTLSYFSSDAAFRTDGWRALLNFRILLVIILSAFTFSHLFLSGKYHNDRLPEEDSAHRKAQNIGGRNNNKNEIDDINEYINFANKQFEIYRDGGAEIIYLIVSLKIDSTQIRHHRRMKAKDDNGSQKNHANGFDDHSYDPDLIDNVLGLQSVIVHDTDESRYSDIAINLQDIEASPVKPLEGVNHELSRLLSRHSSDGSFVLSITTRSNNEALRKRLDTNPYVLSVEHDVSVSAFNDDKGDFPIKSQFLRKTHFTPFGIREEMPYGIKSIEANRVSAPDAYKKFLFKNSTRAREFKPPPLITICIIDSGVFVGHEDFPNGGLNGTSNQQGTWDTDPYGHGTHIAGTLAAAHNSIGVVGIFPELQKVNVKLHIARGLDDSGNGRMSNIMAAMYECKDAGANIINLSLGCRGDDVCYRQTTDEIFTNLLYDDDILVFAAAGNGGNGERSYPASYKSVISVAAVDDGDNHATFSQWNDQVELAAPGVNIRSIRNAQDEYTFKSGTSMAAPHAAGVAALVWSNFPNCTATQIRDVLAKTARDVGRTGCDHYFGFGVVQAQKAIKYLHGEGCGAMRKYLTGQGGCSHYSHAPTLTPISKIPSVAPRSLPAPSPSIYLGP